MIEQLYPIATGRCAHCREEVTQYVSDLRTDAFWSHADSGHQYCADAPLATPDLTTVRPWQRAET